MDEEAGAEPEIEEPAPEPQIVKLGHFDRHGVTRTRLERRWVEVEHGIPGESVEIEIGGSRRRPIGHIVRVLDPAPDRIEPPCPYFRDFNCGGCQWQQIDYQAQLAYKRSAVDETMLQAGVSKRVDTIHALKDPWRYRSTAGIALGRHAGFRRHASLAIVPLDDCPISHPLIGRLMAALNSALRKGELPDFRGRARLEVRVAGTGEEQFLQTLVRPTDPESVLANEGGKLVDMLRGVPEVGGIAVQRIGGRIDTVSGDLLAPVEVAGRVVWLAAGSFFQTNLQLLAELIARVQEEAGTPSRVADIYAGVGIFGLFLAERAAHVVEIEADPVAVQAGQKTAEEWGLANIEFVVGPSEEAELVGYDVVIVDPPRSGLDPEVLDAILASRPELLLYVSCLAESLARDLGVLQPAGYEVSSLEVFDFYPQTYHVEMLAVLRR
ncbi:MAG: 23S rRNA (uracil(1939)-C(5))-methyltransferase RlmD [Chloroflexota bacterium]